ncbi:kinase-like domain-containing protein [Rhizophagus clarus]|uniref:Kinase-like domain-containing protein n=1 Tax=Rhizophagus clarus TaxID=94130 RepID=A0A8H3LUR1_9GLOM|nr:kinase-like domain-containing protein [Rhizophagus clarus]
MSSNNTKENFEKTFHQYQETAEDAICYRIGIGTEKNLEKAVYWYQKAAESGDKYAMFSLAILYENEIGAENNLKKAFFWYRKAVINDVKEAIFNLAVCYDKGIGTEKNLEEAFYWYQKAAENGNERAMFNLAICYHFGVGTEKNLEIAVYWYQKAVDHGDKNAMINLANCYFNGDGTEKNLEKAFYLYQKVEKNNNEDYLSNCYRSEEETAKKAFNLYKKSVENAAENGDMHAMLNLSNCYYNEKGTEKNLEKAYYWCQKSVKNGNIEAMVNLADFHYNGEGTVKNLNEALYWYRKAEKNGSKVAMNKLAIYYKNEEETENSFCQYKKLTENGDIFATFCLASCYENGIGIEKDLGKALYFYQIAAENAVEISNGVAVKYLANCYNNKKEMEEAAENGDERAMDYLAECYYTGNGIERNLEKAFYWCQKAAEKGGFSEIHKALWSDGPIDSWNYHEKQWNRWNSQTGYEVVLKILNDSSSLNNKFLDEWKYHYNLSDDYNEVFIIDLGLCKPIGDFQSDKEVNEIYGVLPYMAPEILSYEPYTTASDIYSFSMIMWEFTSGIPPFNDEAHDHRLFLDICEGSRPKITRNTPKCYIDLMQKCWDSDPKNRPTIMELERKISGWNWSINEYYKINGNGDDEKRLFKVPNIDDKLENDMNEFVKANSTNNLVQEQTNNSVLRSHSQAYYTSRKLTEILVKENSEYLEYMI